MSLLDCKTTPSFARSPKIGVFEQVLSRGREMGERGDEAVARPGYSFFGPFFYFTTARQNSLKNPDFRTSGQGRGCFAVCNGLRDKNLLLQILKFCKKSENGKQIRVKSRLSSFHYSVQCLVSFVKTHP